MSDLPDPLVPADVDLRGLPWMRLDIHRLLASELVALGTPEECWYALMLWMRAWQQVPAASLPDDERVLAAFSGAGRRWRKVRDMALRGFVRCSDGRLYHRVLAEQALLAWPERVKHREKRERDADRLRRWRERKRSEEEDETGDETRTETQVKRVSSRTDGRGTGEGRERDGTGEGRDEQPDLCSTGVSPPAPPIPAGRAERSPPARSNGSREPKGAATWAAYCRAYDARYGVEPPRNAKGNTLCCRLVDRVGAEEAPAVAAWFVGHPDALYTRGKHPLDLLVRDAERLHTEWATGQIGTASRARQEDRRAGNAMAVEEAIAQLRRERDAG